MSNTECRCEKGNNEAYGTPVPPGKIRVRWDRIIGATVVGALLGGLAVWGLTIATDEPTPLPAATTEAPEYALTACATEDSTDCVWVASPSGNNTGTSFVNIDGTTYYDESALITAQTCIRALEAWSELSERNAFDMASQWASESAAIKEGNPDSGATYGEYVITDNLQPVSDRLSYILDNECAD